MFKKPFKISAIALTALITSTQAIAYEWSGDVTLEWREFSEPATFNTQEDRYISLSATPEFYHAFENSQDSITFEAFIRADEHDDNRSHADIRELYWLTVKDDWELRVGINKVFWGVTETIHLVDIINQTDAVENIDGEDKLGQPMIDLTLLNDWGIVDIFLLTGFRERTFVDESGRPRLTPLPVNTDEAIYESEDEDSRIDFAIRWSNTIGIWDIGVSHFSGTNRDPSFSLDNISIDAEGNAELIPTYAIIDQTGADIQATFESWLLKIEAISRSGQGKRYSAAAIGTEYTFYNIKNTGYDIGIVSEYLFDDRDEQPFQNDIALGLRLTLNDVQSTEALFALITDADNQSTSYFLEASRRIGNSLKLSLEFRGTTDVADDDALQVFENEDFIQIELGYFF